MSKTVWIIAGETSGDNYGARLATEIRLQEADTTIKGMGGTAMKEAGVEIMVDSTELGIVGFVEVFKHIFTFYKIFYQLLDRAKEERPDVVVLIDYPGFNIRFAKKIHELGIKVVYYVSPQVWAWKKKRKYTLAKCVDHMMAIFPFEPEVYNDTDLDVKFIGHPLLEIMAEKKDPHLTRDPNMVLLLPGSRTAEIEKLLEPILLAAKQMRYENRDLKFVMSLPRQSVADMVKKKIAEKPSLTNNLRLDIDIGQTHNWMQVCSAGIAASGTVTVEAAIMGLPLVSIYKTNPVTYWIGRKLVDLPYFTMVNLILNRELFKEFLQEEATPENIFPEALAILPDGSRGKEVREGLDELISALGKKVRASAMAAEITLNTAGEK